MTNQGTPTTFDLAGLLARIATLARQAVPCDGGIIALAEPGQTRLIPHAFAADEPPSRLPPAPDDGPLHWVAATRQPLLVPDLGQSEFRPESSPGPDRLRSLAAVPLLLDGHVLGVLQVNATQPHALSAADLAALGAVGDQVSLALETARQHAQLQARYDELSAAYRELLAHSEFSTLAAHEDSLAHVLQAMTIRLAEISGAAACALMIWDGATQRPDRLAVHGLDLDATPQGPVAALLATLTEQVMSGREPVIQHDLAAVATSEALVALGFHSLAGLPLATRGRRLGACFLLSHAADQPFAATAADKLDPLLKHVALVIDNKLLLQATRRQLSQTALLLETSAITASTRGLPDILAQTLSLTRAALGVGKAAFLLYDKPTNSLVAQPDTSLGFDLPEGGLRFPAGDPANQLAITFMASQPFFTNDPARLRIPPAFLRQTGIHALVCVPLRVQDDPLGVFLVADPENEPFTRNHTDLLTAIASHIAAALRSEQLARATQAHLRETEALQRIAVITSATLDMDEMLSAALEQTVSLMRVAAALLLLPDKAGRFLTLHESSRTGLAPNAARPAWPLDGHGHLIHAYHTGKPFYSNDVLDDEVLENPAALGLRVRNVITCPLNTRNRTLGVLCLLNHRQGGFSENDLDLARAVASQVAVSLESTQLFAAERARADLMAQINRISQDLDYTLDIPTLLCNTGQDIHSLLGYEGVSILLLDETGLWLNVVASASQSPGLVWPVGTALHASEGIAAHGIAAQAIASHETQNVPDVRESSAFMGQDGIPPALHAVAACLTVPLRSGDTVLGVLDLTSTRVNGFNATDQNAMQTLAAQIATAVANVRLFRQAQRQARDQGFLREATVEFSRTIVMEHLLEQITDYAASALDASHSAVVLFENTRVDRRHFHPPRTDPESTILGRLGATAERFPALLAELSHPRTVYLPGQVSPATRAELDAILPADGRTHLLTPIVQRAVVMGIIEVVVVQPNRLFERHDIALIEGLAQQAAIAAENVRLIEELEQRALELAEANRLKSDFLASISHELRTPMNSIIGFSDMLLGGLYGGLADRQRDRVERIRRNGRNLLMLIDDLLDISKIEAGKLELTIEPVSLAHEVRAALDGAESQIAARGLSLRVDVPDGLPPIHADALRLRQIINNLLSNAMKFTTEGGIQVTAGVDDPADPHLAWCAISDTGIGIAPENQTMIFDEFRQVDGTTTREYGGTGLGLAISRRLVEMMGGNISVRSALGEGSTFTFRLPTSATLVLPRQHQDR